MDTQIKVELNIPQLTLAKITKRQRPYSDIVPKAT